MLDCRSKSRPFKEVGPTLFTTEKWETMSNAEYGLSFSAHDLLIRLVRGDRAIRGKITKLAEPLWFHHGSYPEAAVQIADVRELLQHRLIEFSAKWFQRGEELYKPGGGNKSGRSGSGCARQKVSNDLLGKRVH